MNCKEVKSLFSEHYDQELSQEVKASIRKHLALCRECSTDYESFHKALKILKKLKAVEPKRDYVNKKQN
jgi:predicted anti-sigma-YlaC factor YlaD